MRVLLVEDDPELGPELQRSLERAGYAVDLSQEGQDAQALGEIEPYDLIILDLGLPGISGLQILQKWRSCQLVTPVIILTARDAWQDKVTGFQAGADDYLAKPFQIEELLARMSAVLKRSQAQAPGKLVFESLQLDEKNQQVSTPHDDAITLTGTEYKLLRYFMLHPHRLISKTELTDHVYALDSDKDSNVIEVYINRLRRKIGADFIHTKRGQGYRFGE